MAQQRSKTGEADGEIHVQLHYLQLSSPLSGLSTDELPKHSDICPVCKSSRYLNPKIRFLINPECYHRMCESCIDRIFSQGPAPCPVAGCGRTLRKARFRKQTFEDVKIERECDIRGRINNVYVVVCDLYMESLLAYFPKASIVVKQNSQIFAPTTIILNLSRTLLST